MEETKIKNTIVDTISLDMQGDYKGLTLIYDKLTGTLQAQLGIDAIGADIDVDLPLFLEFADKIRERRE